MTRKSAVAFVRYHGVVLESARGLEPSLAEHIAGGAIHGRAGALDRIQEAHLPSGRHKRQDVAFPAWVPDEEMSRARAVPESDAAREIQRWLARYGQPTRPFA